MYRQTLRVNSTTRSGTGRGLPERGDVPLHKTADCSLHNIPHNISTTGNLLPRSFFFYIIYWKEGRAANPTRFLNTNLKLLLADSIFILCCTFFVTCVAWKSNRELCWINKGAGGQFYIVGSSRVFFNNNSTVA